MYKLVFPKIIATASLPLLALAASSAAYAQVDQIYYGGNIVTMNEKNLFVEAVAVEGDRITHVGRLADIKPLTDDGTERIDLEGKTMLPGFIDPHGHFVSAGTSALQQVDLNPPPIGNVTSMDDLIAKLTDEAEANSESEVIRGARYDDTLLDESRHPTREDLDQVSTSHPVIAKHISGHVTAVNSKALEMADITADTTDPDGGRVAKDSETGDPTGVLEGNAGQLVSDLTPETTKEDQLAGIRKASEMWTAHGFTTANDQPSNPDMIDVYKEALNDEDLFLRLTYWPRETNIEDARTYPAVESGSDITAGSNMIHHGPMKLVIDGSPQGYTAHFSQPYKTQRPQDDGSYRGFPYWDDRDEFFDFVEALHREGWQVTVHSNGDQGIQDTLDAFAAAQLASPREDARHTIQHSQFTRPDQLNQMAALDVHPDFFIGHTFYWGDRHKNVFFGESRAEHMSPLKGAYEHGLTPTTHTDTPVVPIDGIQMIWSSVNRMSTDGDIIGEDQQVAPLEALKAITTNAAWQYFQEDIKGSIEPGKLADFVILSDNPLSIGHLDPMKIKDIKVLETIVGGETVFEGETESIVAEQSAE
ncbi:amidohydrolase [Halomonas garicola]|uniref:amidohydrolase n=1 Tax=Halomonas garicola TaxID=1690008 RepID=UPI0028983A82|nr:amidohydrolase family protein [Halomonas garicola]